MAFVSHAQNFEDVMLWRALCHVRRGFYIDVGAADSSLYSVTRAFYDQGWCGINIEPVPAHFSALRNANVRMTLICLMSLALRLVNATFGNAILRDGQWLLRQSSHNIGPMDTEALTIEFYREPWLTFAINMSRERSTFLKLMLRASNLQLLKA